MIRCSSSAWMVMCLIPQVVSGTLYASPYAAGDLILIAPINSDILLAALTTTGAQQWTYMPEK